MFKLSPVAKTVIAVVGGLVTLIANAAVDGNVDANEVATLIGATVTAYGVWRVPNKPSVSDGSQGEVG